MTKPEYDHPGVNVDEAAAGAPIEGVPTDALTSRDRRRWVIGIIILGFVLAGLGFALAMARVNALYQLIDVPGGVEIALAILGVALLLSAWRALVEWRRRRAGRPPLRISKLIIGIAIIRIVALVAATVGIVALVASLLTRPPLRSLLFDASANLLCGYLAVSVTVLAIRELLLLVEATRSDPSGTSLRT